MEIDDRYLRHEVDYKPFAAEALASCFVEPNGFDLFYAVLSNGKKNELLRAASFYLFLVKRSDWHECVDGNDRVVDYLTNSYKVVGLFSLIESTSDARHEDFYQWLLGRPAGTFPIEEGAKLSELYAEYKLTFGSIRRCVAFFDRLPPARQQQLRDGVLVNGIRIGSIKKLAEFLYNLRSKFVHSAELVLQVGELRTWTQDKKGITETVLPITLLLSAFEEGLVAYFRDVTS